MEDYEYKKIIRNLCIALDEALFASRNIRYVDALSTHQQMDIDTSQMKGSQMLRDVETIFGVKDFRLIWKLVSFLLIMGADIIN